MSRLALLEDGEHQIALTEQVEELLAALREDAGQLRSLGDDRRQRRDFVPSTFEIAAEARGRRCIVWLTSVPLKSWLLTSRDFSSCGMLYCWISDAKPREVGDEVVGNARPRHGDRPLQRAVARGCYLHVLGADRAEHFGGRIRGLRGGGLPTVKLTSTLSPGESHAGDGSHLDAVDGDDVAGSEAACVGEVAGRSSCRG